MISHGKTIASTSETHPCAQQITEMIISGLEAYFPHTFLIPKVESLGSNQFAHTGSRRHPSPEIHTLYTYCSELCQFRSTTLQKLFH